MGTEYIWRNAESLPHIYTNIHTDTKRYIRKYGWSWAFNFAPKNHSFIGQYYFIVATELGEHWLEKQMHKVEIYVIFMTLQGDCNGRYEFRCVANSWERQVNVHQFPICHEIAEEENNKRIILFN